MGSTLFELAAGKFPYAELYPIEPKNIAQSSDPKIMFAQMQQQHAAGTEVEKRFSNFEFPDDVSDTFQGDIISGCWNEIFSSAEEALLSYIGD